MTRILSLKIIQGKKSPNDKLVLINDHAVTSMEIALTLAHFCNNDEMRYVNGADKVQEFFMKALIHYRDIVKFGTPFIQKMYNDMFVK